MQHDTNKLGLTKWFNTKMIPRFTVYRRLKRIWCNSSLNRNANKDSPSIPRECKNIIFNMPPTTLYSKNCHLFLNVLFFNYHSVQYVVHTGQSDT
jgi:hypothetical protein